MSEEKIENEEIKEEKVEETKQNKKGKVKKKRNVKQIIFVAIAVIAVLLFAFYKMQRELFFYPGHDKKSYEELSRTASFETVKIYYNRTTSASSSASLDFSNEEIILQGWIKFNKPKEEKSPLIIYFGGNAGNSSAQMNSFNHAQMFQTYFPEFNFMTVDYPGYGLSTGEPSDDTMFEAGEQIYDYAKVQSYVDPSRIIIIGYSIGTGVASHVASYSQAPGLVLIAPYDKGNSLYNGAINSFYGPMKSLMRYDFNSSKEAETIVCSPLIIASRDDEIIDYHWSLNLGQYFKVEPEYLIIENITHNYYLNSTPVLEKMAEYCSNHIKNNTENTEPEGVTDGNN